MSKRSADLWWVPIAVLFAACAQDAAPNGGTDSETAQPRHLLATSATHSCAIRQDGLYCWGRNGRGELGDGSTTDSVMAVRAQVAGDDAVEVAAHSGRTCILRSTGELACWGANKQGQIGDGTYTDALTAVPASGIAGATALAIDDNSTCVAHGPDRSVSCWGESSASTPDQGYVLPEPIAGVSRVKQLSVGAFGSYCALDDAGAIQCWHIEQGRWSPTKQVVLEGAHAIAMPHKDYVCASLTDKVVCQNTIDGTRVELPDSAGTVDVTAGSGGLVVCSVNADARWRCWNLPSFTLPDMGLTDVAGMFPFAVESDLPLRDLAIAGFRLCVLREDNTVACGDGADESSAAKLIAEMRIEIADQVQGLPE